MSAPSASPHRDTEPVWLSGPILTFLNKLVFPAALCVVVAGIPLWVLATKGRISIAGGFRFIAVFGLLATLFLSWFAIHLQSVGYSCRTLVVKNPWRRASVPFQNIADVERVWWGKGQVVRIRFVCRTPFGSVVYYMPKWAPLRALFGAPEVELKTVMSEPPHTYG